MEGASIKPRVAVVTGGNKGIGLGVCKELAKLPNYVTILTSRDEAAGRAAVAALQGEEGVGQLVFHPLDVSSDESVEQFKAFVLREYGRVDVLVNNAGNLHEGSSLTLPIQGFQAMLEVHVTGALRMTQAFLPVMKQHGFGRIINVTSGVAQLSMLTAGLSAPLCGYAIAKLGLNGITLLSAAEVKPEEDILINALIPGFVRSDMSKRVVPEELPQQLGTRWRTPDEAGQDVVHLVTQPATGPRGKLLQEGKEQPW